MGSSQVPDVRVTLSAEGVGDIVKAFQQVSAAAKRTGKDSAAGVGLLSGALKDLKQLAPTIGLAAAGAGVAVLVKNALEGADAIGKLQQKTGLATETLSTLAYGAQQADVDFDTFSGGLTKFGKTMEQVDQGSTTAGSAVRRLLGSSQALNGLNTDQRFTKVVTALAQMSDGYQKTRAAQDFFGKGGAELLPLIDELGTGGFDALRKKAESLGLVLSQQTVDAATAAREALKNLHAEAQGAATEFVSGLAPALAAAGEAIVEATSGGGTNGFQSLGEAAGAVVKTITKGFLIVGSTIGFVFGEASLLFDDFGARAKDTLTGVANTVRGLAGKAATYEGNLLQPIGGLVGLAGSGLQSLGAKINPPGTSTSTQFGHRLRGFQNDLAKQLDDLDKPAVTKPTKPAAGGGTAAGNANWTARLAAAKSALDDELALYRAHDELVAAEEARAYAAGEISIAEYFADRAKAIQEGTDKEIDALAKQYLALQAPIETTPGETDDQIAAKKTERLQQIASVQNRIYLAQLNGQKQLEANDEARQKATVAFNETRLQVEKEIQQAQGDTYAAALAAIDKNSAELAAKGVPPALIDQLAALQRAQAALAEIDRQGNLATGALGVTQAGLQNRVASGDLFPFQALEAYDAAVQQALPHLRALAAQMTASAVTPEDLLKAQQFTNQIDAMAAASSQTARELGALKTGVQDALTNGLTEFFTTGISQAKTFGDAIRSMAQSIIGSIQQVVAQLLAARIVKGIFSFLGFLTPSAGGADAAAIPYGSAGGAGVLENRVAASGPGIAASLSRPSLSLSSEARAALSGMSTADFSTALRLPAVNARPALPYIGADVGGAGSAGGATGRTHITLDLPEGFYAKQMDTTAGHQVIVRATVKNKNSVRQGLGISGTGK